jgi:Holliday junction resolvasome RuvABC ATP-dependent DNA helicase subunit
MDDRIISARPDEEEILLDQALRPQRLQDLIGQKNLCTNLAILIEAARKRDEAIAHHR